MDVNDCSDPCRWSGIKHCLELFFKVCDDHFALTRVHERTASPPERRAPLMEKKSKIKAAMSTTSM